MSHSPYKPNNPLEMLKGLEGNHKAKEAAFQQAIMTAPLDYAKGHNDGWQAAAAQSPAWHDAPTCPGLWLSDYESVFNIKDAEDYIYNSSKRWYGPIPEDKPRPPTTSLA
jgi:hypothetical protein